MLTVGLRDQGWSGSWQNVSSWLGEAGWKRSGARGKRRQSLERRCSIDGFGLKKAQSWLEKRPEQIHPVDQQFVLSSLSRNASAMKKATRQKRLAFASLGLLTLILFGGGPWVYSVFSKHRQDTIELLDKALSEKAQTTARRIQETTDDFEYKISFATRASATTMARELGFALTDVSDKCGLS